MSSNRKVPNPIDKNDRPIRIDGRVAADVEGNARYVLALAKRGAKVIFPDVFAIFQGLECQLQQAEAELSQFEDGNIRSIDREDDGRSS